MIRLGRRLALPLGAVAMLAWMSAASAREVLTPEEQAERELEAKKRAPPVLVVEPAELNATLGRGETKALLLAVKNAGGQVLRWTVVSSPTWAPPDPRRGELGFGGRIDLAVVIDPARLAPGANRGELVVAAPGVEGSPATVAIVIRMPAPLAEERRAPAESTGKARLRAPLPVRLDARFKPAGAWTIRPMFWQVAARTYVQGETFSPIEETSAAGPALGLELSRSWEVRRVDLSVQVGLAKLDTWAPNPGDAIFRRTCYFSGLAAAYPSGSRFRGFVSAALWWGNLTIEDIGPAGEDAASSNRFGPDVRAGLIYSFSRRFSLEAHARFGAGSGDGHYGSWSADIDDVTNAFGVGLSFHF